MSDIVLTTQTTPATPGSGKADIFVDSSTKQIKSVNDAGALTTYAEITYGDFTPVLVSAGGTITNTQAFGTYAKIGKMVSFTCSMSIQSVSSPTGQLSVNGLPLTCANGIKYRSAVSIVAGGLDTGVNSPIAGEVVINTTTINLYKFLNGTGTDLADAVKAGTVFYITGTYYIE